MSKIFESILPGTNDYDLLEYIINNKINNSNWIQMPIPRKSTTFYNNEHGIYTLNNFQLNGDSFVPYKYFMIIYARNNNQSNKYIKDTFTGNDHIKLYSRYENNAPYDGKYTLELLYDSNISRNMHYVFTSQSIGNNSYDGEIIFKLVNNNSELGMYSDTIPFIWITEQHDIPDMPGYSYSMLQFNDRPICGLYKNSADYANLGVLLITCHDGINGLYVRKQYDIPQLLFISEQPPIINKLINYSKKNIHNYIELKNFCKYADKYLLIIPSLIKIVNYIKGRLEDDPSIDIDNLDDLYLLFRNELIQYLELNNTIILQLLTQNHLNN